MLEISPDLGTMLRMETPGKPRLILQIEGNSIEVIPEGSRAAPTNSSSCCTAQPAVLAGVLSRLRYGAIRAAEHAARETRGYHSGRTRGSRDVGCLQP